MTSIIRATIEHSSIILNIGKQAWVDAHGHSASKEDIDTYLSKNYTEGAIIDQLSNDNNLYHIIFHNNQPAGFSKVILNKPNTNVTAQDISVLDRIYLLNSFQGLKLGSKLLAFNIDLAKENAQSGIWLAAWIENKKAISFYKKRGFEIVGKYDFPISSTHVNPNHIMYLSF